MYPANSISESATCGRSTGRVNVEFPISNWRFFLFGQTYVCPPSFQWRSLFLRFPALRTGISDIEEQQTTCKRWGGELAPPPSAPNIFGKDPGALIWVMTLDGGPRLALPPLYPSHSLPRLPFPQSCWPRVLFSSGELTSFFVGCPPDWPRLRPPLRPPRPSSPLATLLPCPQRRQANLTQICGG